MQLDMMIDLGIAYSDRMWNAVDHQDDFEWQFWKMMLQHASDRIHAHSESLRLCASAVEP